MLKVIAHANQKGGNTYVDEYCCGLIDGSIPFQIHSFHICLKVIKSLSQQKITLNPLKLISRTEMFFCQTTTLIWFRVQVKYPFYVAAVEMSA